MENGKSEQNRYLRGIKRLTPEIVERIQLELGKDPSMSKSELARRVGVARSTLILYLKRLPEQVKEAAAKNDEIKNKAVLNQIQFLEKIQQLAGEIHGTILELKTGPIDPENASVQFRGYSTLHQFYRLLGEALGELAPPTQNVFLVRLEQIASRDIELELPAGLKADIEEAELENETVR